MPIANLFNIPETENDMMVWSFNNQAEHVLIVNAIAAQKGAVVPLFALDPFPVGGDVATWARLHQEAHNNFTGILGINGVDLTDVDLKDRAQLESFITLHANEHLQAAKMLGLA